METSGGQRMLSALILKSDWRCIIGFARKPDKLGHPWDMMRFISPTFDLWSLFSSASLVASGSLLQSRVSLVAEVQRGLTAALPLSSCCSAYVALWPLADVMDVGSDVRFRG